MDIGKKIKELRTRKGITVNRLANLSGVSQSYLRDIELGNKQPTVEYLSYICEGLEITLSEFFECSEKTDELTHLINKLKPEQKYSLIEFLKTMLSI